jgi:hypothetical protein
VQWHRLPPRDPGECPFRTGVERQPSGESATCELVRSALPLADEWIRQVSLDACTACLRLDPATPTTWNTVVASLIYQAAEAAGSDPAASPEVLAQAAEARAKAESRLELVDLDPTAESQPVEQFTSLRELIPPPRKRRRQQIVKWAVGVTTSPRRAPTLERCLDHLTRAGWDAPHLFMDGTVRLPERFGHLPGTLRNPLIGAWPNHYLALFELTLRQPDAEAYLIMQDDALIYDGENVREYLELALWPAGSAPIISLYCPGIYNANRYGWHRFRKSWVWGAQAFVFSRGAAQSYLRDRRICRHRWRSPDGGLTQIDVLLGWWAWWRRVPVWYPTPSLVQHVGNVSTLWVDNRTEGKRAANLFVAGRGCVRRSAEDLPGPNSSR